MYPAAYSNATFGVKLSGGFRGAQPAMTCPNPAQFNG